MYSRQLVVLVGGLGTRLGEATRYTPKPLIPIASNKVFLDYFLDNAGRQGFQEILLIAGHFGDQVFDRYDGKQLGNVHLKVVIEPEPMGTAGALRFAREHLNGTFLVANGDTLFDINMRAVDEMLLANPQLSAVLALRLVPDTARYGQVRLNAAGTIESFEEKVVSPTPRPGLINGGIYAMRREIVDALPEGPVSAESYLFPRLAKAGRLGGKEAAGYFLDIGLPETLQIARAELPSRRRRVLFLDRDGVINVDKGYVHKVEDFEWIAGIVDLIRQANDAGRAVVVITNQAGVARGYYTEDDVKAFHGYLQDILLEKGAFIDAFYYCPYHPDAVIDFYRVADHPDRKPNPGMILRAIKDMDLDIEDAVLIGDNDSDVAAATAAGVRGVLFPGGSIVELGVKL
jgi:D,D-heptose 1,7-bisphosphate phosphatase